MKALDFPATTSGVYHLLKGGRVMYVGQSTNVLRRVASWITPGVERFDGWRFFPCNPAYLDAEELRHIREYDPPMNADGRTRPYKGAPRRMPPPPPPTLEQIKRRLQYHGDTVPGGVIRGCGLDLPNRELCNLEDFPAPAQAFERNGWNGKAIVARWRSEDVLRWFERRTA